MILAGARLPPHRDRGAKGASIAGKTPLKPTKSRFHPFAGGRPRGKKHLSDSQMHRPMARKAEVCIDPRQCALAAICDPGDVNSQVRAHAFGVRL